jgi:hypothetical protein
MDEKKLEIFYDHYKDTFENQKTYLQKRNTYSVVALLLMVVLSFQISEPDATIAISKQIIDEKLAKITIDFAYLNSLFLFTFLWVLIMYFQINLLIERNYKYIHEIEAELSKHLIPFQISREGNAYLKQYPWISSLVYRIYTIVFPITLIGISLIKWLTEKEFYSIEAWKSLHFLFDTGIIVSVILLTILYLIKIHFNDFKK